MCASRRGNRVMAIDMKRAYFYAPATRPIYVEIPAEDRAHNDSDKVGALNLSLYGTRDAAVNWVRACTKVLKNAGFIVGRHCAQNFWHPHREVAVTVHGDDFTSTGSEEQLLWLKGVLGKEFEFKTEVLGPPRSTSKRSECSTGFCHGTPGASDTKLTLDTPSWW